MGCPPCDPFILMGPRHWRASSERRFDLRPGRTSHIGVSTLLIGLLVLLLFPAGSAGAEEPAGQLLHFNLLRDVPDDVDVQSICCSNAYSFDDTQHTSVASHYGERTIWLRIDRPDKGDLIILRPALDEVTLFAKTQGSQGWTAYRTGEIVPMAERAIKSPFMALPLPPDLADTAIFVRIVQPTKLTISIQLWNSSAFQAMQAADRTFKTFLFGFLFATIIYNGLVGLMLRDMAFLLNALSMSSLLGLALYLSGYGAAFVWSGRPEWSNFVSQASIGLAVVFGAFFMWTFVRGPQEPYRRGWPLFVAPGLVVISSLLALVLPYWRIQLLMLVAAAVLFVFALYFVGRRALAGDIKARVLLIPLSLAMIPGTAIVAAQKILGVEFPSLDNNLLEITFCLEALMFSLAIASRVRISEIAARESSDKLMALRNESAARVIAAQDTDRQRLAKELHDGVGQDFLVVLGNLKRLGRETGSGNWKQAIPGLIQSATTALDELRRISKDMHPASISHLGLNKAIEALFENLESASQIETDLTLSLDEARLSSEAKLHIYRIVQECLSNISRHSGASRCRASIVEDTDRLSLTLEDDGAGLEAGNLKGLPTSGLGFTSIEERVRSLNGHWAVSNGEWGGMKIDVTVPMPCGAAKIRELEL